MPILLKKYKKGVHEFVLLFLLIKINNMDYTIRPKLTRKYILERISQEDIMEKYLGIQVNFNELICSPLRVDPNPTCGFKYSQKGVLRFRDFAGYFWGDCFDVVAYRLNQNYAELQRYDIPFIYSNNKRGFGVILDKIARDFKLHKYSNNIDEEDAIIYTKSAQLDKINSITKINIKKREWNIHDKHYWEPYGIFQKSFIENLFKVYPVEHAWINGTVIYNYTKNDPCYAYYFGTDENDVHIFKLYFPYRKKGENRFIQNKAMIQGLDQFIPNDIGVITKSYKDVMCLYKYDISSIALNAENAPLTVGEFNSIKHYCNHWFTLTDYDYSGIKVACDMRRLHNTTPLFITDYPFKISNIGKFKNGIKDFSDMRKIFKHTKTEEIVNQIKTKIEDELYNY